MCYFLVLSSVILLNIVMAVLVDEFIRCVEAEKQADRLEQLADLSAQSCFLNTLDPLLRELCVSSTNLDAINSRIADLFHFCDVDESGDINYSEFREGLRKLPFDLPFSAEDWDVFASCEEELSAPMFLEAMQQSARSAGSIRESEGRPIQSAANGSCHRRNCSERQDENSTSLVKRGRDARLIQIG